MPDLIRFWPAERRYELIEVKGPGDRLQDNQIRWLAYCVQHGMPVRVVDVRWADEALAMIAMHPSARRRIATLTRGAHRMSYVVAVRAMCEFTARRGDLDLRFTPAPTSLEGMAGHITVAGRAAQAATKPKSR